MRIATFEPNKSSLALIASKATSISRISEANFCELGRFSMPILCAVPLNGLCLVSGISVSIPNSFTLQIVAQTSEESLLCASPVFFSRHPCMNEP